MPAGDITREVLNFLRRHLTPAVRVLFILNVGLFLLQWTLFRFPGISKVVMLGQHSVVPETFACSAYWVFRGMVWQPLTYAFFHADPMHLLGNMLFLWFLGPMVERRLGTYAFYRVYLFAALAGGLAHLSLRLLGETRPIVGASGAVMAISVICAIYHFHMRILLFGVFPIKLGYLIIILLVIDFLTLTGPGHSGVASHAHLVGAGVGYAYVKVDWSWLDIWKFRGRRFLAMISPVRIRRVPKEGRKGNVVNMFDDDDAPRH